MKISDNIIEEIRNNINIVDFISNHVELKQAGTNFKGLCPFHSEKTPSFSVSPEKGLYHCFGCGASGNIFTFIMQFHNLEFIEAVKFLAEKLGISIEEDNSFKSKKSLEEINKYILSTAKNCFHSENGKKAKDYMISRNFNDNICKEFSIGFLPDYLKYKKIISSYSDNILKESGLFYFGKNNNVHSRFSGRLIIPIFNIYGKIIGFSGRILQGEGAKYINSPETPLFKKREVLFNLDKAKKYIKAENNTIIVEGYFDVMRLYDNGMKNVVSPMGTSLTKEQALILKRYSDETTLIFDGDDAGKKAAFRALDVFIEINYYPSVVFLEKGEDPDSIVLKKGISYFKQLVESREDLLLFVAKKSAETSKNHNIKMQRLAKIKEKLLKIIDPHRKEFYIKKVADAFDINNETLQKEISDDSIIKVPSNNNKNITIYYEEDFISALFELDIDVIDSLISDIKPIFFKDEKNANIFKKVIEIISNNGNIHTLLNDFDIGESLSVIRVKDFGKEDSYTRAIRSKNKIIYNYLEKVLKQKNQELSKCTDVQQTEEIIKEIQGILEQKLSIKAQLLEV